MPFNIFTGTKDDAHVGTPSQGGGFDIFSGLHKDNGNIHNVADSIVGPEPDKPGIFGNLSKSIKSFDFNTASKIANNTRHPLLGGIFNLAGKLFGQKTPDLADMESNISASGKEIDTGNTYLTNLKSQLDAQKPDPNDEKSISAYNELVNNFNTKATDLKSKIDSHNNLVTNFQTASAPTPLKTAEAITALPQNIIKGFVNQIVHPDKDEQEFEQQFLAQWSSKDIGEKIVSVPDQLMKPIVRTLYPIFHPIAEDIGQAIAAKEYEMPSKGNFGSIHDFILQPNKNPHIADPSKGLTQEQFDQVFPALKKTDLQKFGDSIQATLGIMAPEFFPEAEGAAAPLLTALKTGAKNGAVAGGLFGGAQVLSSGSKDPAEISQILIGNIVGGTMLGMLTHAAIPGGKAAKEALTKDIIEKWNLPKEITISAEKVKAYQQGAGYRGTEKMTEDEAQAFKDLGLSNKEIRDAYYNGVSIQIPAEKIVTITDKPYWEKVKGLFGFESKPEVTRSFRYGKGARAIKGYLEGQTLPTERTSITDIAQQFKPAPEKPTGKFNIFGEEKPVKSNIGSYDNFNRTLAEVQAHAKEIFGRDIPIQSVTDQSAFSRRNIQGDGIILGQVIGDTIKLLENNGSVSDATAAHENWHYFKHNLLDRESRIEVVKLEKGLAKKFPKLVAEKRADGYAEKDIPEEIMADEFKKYTRTGKTFSEKIRVIFDKIIQNLKLLFNNKSEVLDYFRNVKDKITVKSEPTGEVKSNTKIQRQIDENISPKSEEITRKEDVLLREKIRNQARGAKAGFKAGHAEARESIVNQLKNTFETKLEDVKRKAEVGALKENIKTRDFDRVKSEIVEYAKESLPISEQGKFLTAVKNSKTQNDLIKNFARIDNVASKYELKKAIADLKKTAEKLSESPSISVDYRNKISSIIDDYELSGHSQKTIDELQATQDYLDNAKANGEEVELPQIVLNKLRILSRVSKDDLTLNQVHGLQNQIELLGHLGRTKFETREGLYDSEKNVRKIVLEETATPINSKKKPTRGIGEPKKDWVERYIKLRNTLQKTRIALMPIDGLAEITGMVPMKQDLDLDYGNYLSYNDDRLEKVSEIVKRNGLTKGDMERVGIYAISKQDGGTERLVANNGITEDAINKLTLSEGEQELYDYIIEENRKGYKIVKELAKNLYNVDVGEVKNYVSFHSDTSAMSDLEMADRFGSRPEDAMTNQHIKKNVEKGFIESRAKFSNAPLKTDILDVFVRHWDDVAYMDTMARDIKMYSEIVNSPEMREKLGDVGTLAWREYLNIMARNGGVEGKHRVRALDIIRKNIGAGILAFRISSALVQFSSFADTIGTMGAKFATKGAWNIATSSEWRNFIMDNFPEVRKAMGDDLAFREFGDGLFDKMAKIGLKPLEVLDNLMRSTAASAAYEKVAAERGVEVDLANPDQDIVQEATRLMRFSQGSSFFKDQPLAISAGFGLFENRSLNKTVLTFQGFGLSRFENIIRQVWREGFKKANYTKGFMSLFWFIIFAAAMEEGIRRGTRKLTDLITGDTTDEKGFVRNAAQNVLQGIPIAGQIASALSYSSNPVPVLNAIDDSLFHIPTIFTGKTGNARLKAAVTTLGGAGELFGIPGASQASQLGNKFLKQDPLKEKLSNSIQSAQKKVDDLDQDLVDRVKPIYEKAKALNFGPDAKDVVKGMSASEHAVYQDLKAIDIAKDTLNNSKKIQDAVEQLHTLGFDSPEAKIKIHELLKDKTEYDQYKKIKSILYNVNGTQKDLEGSTDTSDDTGAEDEYVAQRNVIGLISDYAKAFKIDPSNAFKAFFGKEKLGWVKGNEVDLLRYFGIPYDAKGGSEEYVKAQLKKMGIPYSKRKEYNLEHIVPHASGGDNSPENLIIIDRKTHNSYTPFDIAASKAVQEKKLTRREVTKIAKQLKVEKSITVQQALDMIKEQ